MLTHLRIMTLLMTSLVLSPFNTAQSADSLIVIHLANEGFLISDGSRTVLIDALFDKGIPPYRTLSDDQQERLERKTPPFDDIDMALATHHHADHFDASTIATFLLANPEAQFISTPQAVDRLRPSLGSDESISERIKTSLPEEGTRETFTHAGITIRTLNLHHGRRRSPLVQNLGFLIEMGGIKILHVGDTVATAEEISMNNLAEEHIDVALLPYWMLTDDDWKRAVTESIGAKTIIAMHIPGEDAPASYFRPAADSDSLRILIRDRFPNARVPQPGESIRVMRSRP